MKVCVLDSYHHKNEAFLRKAFCLLGWEIVIFDEADVIFSAATYVDIHKYPNKKFIFGPHFSVFPNSETLKFNNVYKNSVYIQPSPQALKVWLEDFNYKTLPLVSFAFGVDVEKFNYIDNESKNENVFIYHKNRSPSDLLYVELFLQSKNINYKIFSYNKRYDEGYYIKELQRSKYGIWVGCHESQGFALEEALSCNVPLLVWTTRFMYQEYGQEKQYAHVNSEMKSIAYWDATCGEFFYKKDDLEQTYEIFIKNINDKKYEPRKYILEQLSTTVRAKELEKLVSSIN
jgi:hypothetical protein